MAFAAKIGKILSLTGAPCAAGGFTAGFGVGYGLCRRQDFRSLDPLLDSSQANLEASSSLLDVFMDFKDRLDGSQVSAEHKQMEKEPEAVRGLGAKELEARAELTTKALDTNLGDCGYLDEF